jgi:hypothetical protein
MYLNNLHGLYYLHGNPQLVGETRDLPIIPKMSGLGPVATSPVTSSQVLEIVSPAISHGELVRLSGDALRTSVLSLDIAEEQEREVWSPFVILPSLGDSQLSGTQSLYWSDGGLPELTLTLRDDNMRPDLNGETPRLALSLEVTPSYQIQPWSGIEIDLPPGWTGRIDPNPSWTVDWTGMQSGEAQLIATPKAATSSPSTIPLSLHPPPISNLTHAFDVIRAHAFNGSFSESNLVVAYPVSTPNTLPRFVYPTTPYLLRPGDQAFFGVAFANGGEATTVTRVDLEVPGGYDVWANDGKGAALFDESAPVGVDGNGGSWRWDDARHVHWSGAVDVPALGAAWFGAMVNVTKRTDQTTSVEPERGSAPTVNVTLANGYSMVSSQWGRSPGIVEARAPPATPLADPANGYDASGNTSFSARFHTTRGGIQSASGSFDVGAEGDLVAMDNAMANSSFAVRQRLVPIGGVVRADADIESMAQQLSALGVADANLTFELYTPVSFGCGPAERWSVGLRSLPHQPVTALELIDADGLGAPDAFVGTQDGQLVRLGPAGVPAWRASLQAPPTSIAWWNASIVDRGILVGDAAGYAHRLDPATGVEAWSRCVARAACSELPNPARPRNVTLSAGPARIAAATLDGELSLLEAGSGAIAVASGEDASSFGQVEWAADGSGDVLVIDAGRHALDRLDGELALRAAVEGEWLAFGQVPAGVRGVVPGEARLMDARTFESLPGSEGFGPALAVAAAAGDVDGDGAPEVVVALDSMRAIVYDGATGARSEYDAGPLQPPVKGWDVVRTQLQGAACSGWRTPDGSSDLDCPAAAGDLESRGSARVAAGPGGVAYLSTVRGAQALALLGKDASPRWVAWLDAKHAATRLRSGAWGADRGIVVGYDDGLVEDRPAAAGGAATTSAMASQSVGRFTFAAPLPRAGFFGSHVLVATLSWQDSRGATQAARLVDWFELVDERGSPVTHPSYRVVLVVGDRGHPIVPGQGAT